MTNFEAFCRVISSSINPLFLKSVPPSPLHFPLLLHARVDDDGQFVLFSAIKQVPRTSDGRTDAETDVCHTLPIFYSNSV